MVQCVLPDRLIDVSFFFFFSFFFFLFFLFFFFLESEHKQEGQRERERKSQADSMLGAQPDAELDLTTPRSQLELKPQIGCLINCVTQETSSSCFSSHSIHKCI